MRATATTAACSPPPPPSLAPHHHLSPQNPPPPLTRTRCFSFTPTSMSLNTYLGSSREMLPKFSQIVNRLYAFIYEMNHSKSGLGLPSIVALVMVIDKSWTLLERHEKAFYTGLTKFVDDCKPLVNSAGNIKCPCKSCRTVLWVSIKNLPKHITRYGWDPGYKTWVHHGEPDLPPLPPVIDNTRQPQMSDMIALLNDLSYIPPNNEQNEPIQEDIGETSNEPTQAKRNEFEELYASANEELYPGCDYVTRLDFMAKFTYFKVKGKLTDSIFNEILEFFQHVLPTTKGYKLPPSHYAIKKTFKTIGLGDESIHACVNDCFLFQGDNNKDLHFRPVCKTSRWKDSNTPGKKVPKKVLRYFLIIPRLQRLYKSSHYYFMDTTIIIIENNFKRDVVGKI
ncbi:hypothetical protein Tco_0881376 [Tanacetum coccineum]